MVTGLGTAGAWGWGREALAAALCESRVALTEVDRSAGYHRREGSRCAALVPPVGLAAWVPPGEARRMSPPSKLALAAARMALADAGLSRKPAMAPVEEGDGLSTAVAIATTFGPSSFTEGLLRQILLEQPEAASPYLFTESVASAPAAQIAIATGARRAGVTVCQREAGPLIAVARGAAEVAAGRADLALAGTVEEITPLLHAVLDRFGALARPGADGEERARPLDRRRNGMLAGEGAAVLALESEEGARERGARVLARVLGWGSAFDPSAPPAGWGSGEAALGQALARGLARAGLAPAGIDRIVAGVSGARAGDRVEALALRGAWGEEALPPVLAPKALTGEYGGGGLAAAVLAAAGADFGPTPGFAEPDPALGVVPHDGRPLPPARHVLATAFAAGGAVAWLLLGAYPLGATS